MQIETTKNRLDAQMKECKFHPKIIGFNYDNNPQYVYRMLR